MLNYLWGGMILIGIVVAAFTGNMQNITQAILDSSKEAITVCVTMMGIIAMWSGMMEIANRSGLIKELSKKMRPFLSYIFPDIPKNHKSLDYISTNVIANILGLGWAATPAGIKAMESLQTINKKKDEASRSMCMFLVFNMSSLQIISVNIIAYRSQFNSANPSEIIAPGLFATLVSTVVGIWVIKIIERWKYR
ncbi:nucleoside recognition domain-containing protein [uncultured Tyzzerella sp.]|uniref:nucleoside recognition domain-containing protein n=1 Tax=uncultured Tyzzerella sp. TaxID=2321398 RepID=UPI0029434E89|nr:nucleoside recognition domain-containing protein [uncultured Tyzzerella sp.]